MPLPAAGTASCPAGRTTPGGRSAFRNLAGDLEVYLVRAAKRGAEIGDGHGSPLAGRERGLDDDFLGMRRVQVLLADVDLPVPDDEKVVVLVVVFLPGGRYPVGVHLHRHPVVLGGDARDGEPDAVGHPLLDRGEHLRKLLPGLGAGQRTSTSSGPITGTGISTISSCM